jgi:hypothetical protein
VGLCLAVFLAGCLALPALALVADTDPVKRIDPVDQGKAASVIFQRADLGAGWRKVSVGPDDVANVACPGFNPDLSNLTVTGEAKATYKKAVGIQSIYSGASVYETKADALALRLHTVKPGLARCLAHTLKQGMGEENGTATIVRQGRIAFPKVAPRTHAFRVMASVSVRQAGQTVTLPFTLHWVGLGRGRAETAFFALGAGKGLPMDELRAFARLLAGRLAAAKL